MIAIHQPNYLPWLGFFDKARMVDTFVILDNVAFTRGNVINRNRIRTKTGAKWITVPVHHPQGVLIRDIQTIDTNWEKDHWKTLAFSYSRAPHFKDISSAIQEVYSKRWIQLVALNETMIELFFDYFDITPEIVRASELSVTGTGSELLVEICKAVGDREYLSGAGAKGYLDLSLFEEQGITVRFQEFISPRYGQLYEPFVPDLSVVDYAFNCGKSGWWLPP